jgi:hypothetical protein
LLPEILAHWSAGKSLFEMAQSFNVSVHGVREALRCQGVDARPGKSTKLERMRRLESGILTSGDDRLIAEMGEYRAAVVQTQLLGMHSVEARARVGAMDAWFKSLQKSLLSRDSREEEARKRAILREARLDRERLARELREKSDTRRRLKEQARLEREARFAAIHLERIEKEKRLLENRREREEGRLKRKAEKQLSAKPSGRPKGPPKPIRIAQEQRDRENIARMRAMYRAAPIGHSS